MTRTVEEKRRSVLINSSTYTFWITPSFISHPNNNLIITRSLLVIRNGSKRFETRYSRNVACLIIMAKEWGANRGIRDSAIYLLVQARSIVKHPLSWGTAIRSPV